MNYAIENECQSPIYKQLQEQIIEKISRGELKPGDRLPTERDLSTELHIARGTVKKAYEELEKNGVLEIIQGSGSYVRDKRTAEAKNRFSAMRMNNAHDSVHIAFVDCNLDSLALFKQQLESIPGKTLSVYLLDAVKMDDDPAALLSRYDMVVTTFSHYDELCACMSDYCGKLIKVAVSPSQRTIVEIATIPTDANIGLICRNDRFLSIMRGNLASLLPNNNKIQSLFEEDYITMLESIQKVEVVIAAPDSIIFDSKLTENPSRRIIAFHYQIERGSILYIEEQVKSILSAKAERSAV